MRCCTAAIFGSKVSGVSGASMVTGIVPYDTCRGGNNIFSHIIIWLSSTLYSPHIDRQMRQTNINAMLIDENVYFKCVVFRKHYSLDLKMCAFSA